MLYLDVILLKILSEFTIYIEEKFIKLSSDHLHIILK